MDLNTFKDIFTNKVNGATFISIDTVTDVKLAGGKSNVFQGRVQKRVTGSNVMVFQNKNSNAYENMVNRRLQKEGMLPSFTVGPRAWGTRIENTPFVVHKGDLYLEVIFLKAGEVTYLVDGKETDESTIPGMPEKESGVGDGWEQGGLNRKVIIRTYKVSSIKAFTIDKQHYAM